MRVYLLLIVLFLNLSSFTSKFDKTPYNAIKLIKMNNETFIYLNQSINFDLNEVIINESSKKQLFIILSYLRRYSNLQIEISVHNSFKTKVDLSQIRADVLKKFFLKYGIKDNHIIAKGYNTSKYINYCRIRKKCTEKQNNINRRIEIKILNPEILSESNFVIVQK